MEVRIIRDGIPLEHARALARSSYGAMVKGVADIERNIIALGGEFHMDANNVLIADGSRQDTVWGFNLYPDKPRDSWLEFISLINIRPAQGNMDMEIADAGIRERIRVLVGAKLKP